MWSVQSFLNPKIGWQKTCTQKQNLHMSEVQVFFSKCHEHGCSCWKAEFQPKFYKWTNSQLFAWLFTCLSHLFDNVMKWEPGNITRTPPHCTAARGRALQALERVRWDSSHPEMHLQLCWHGKMQHQWSIYFLKQSLAALIGHVMIIRDTIHGFVDMCFLEHPKY